MLWTSASSGLSLINALYSLIGKRAIEVISVSSKNREDFDHDTTFDLFLRFKNGETGRVFCSYDTVNPYIFNICIYGDKGSIRNNLLYSKNYFPGQIDWIKIPSILPDTADVAHHPFPELVDYYVNCIRDDVMPEPSVKDVMHVFEIIEIAERSAIKRSKLIKIPFE